MKKGGRKANDSSLKHIRKSDSISSQDGPEMQVPLPLGVGDGGIVGGEGVTPAGGWPHLGRGRAVLTSQNIRPAHF